MKVLVSWPWCAGENTDAPDVIAVLIPTKEFYKKVSGYMNTAQRLEGEIPGFIRMDIQDWTPLFLDASDLNSLFEEDTCDIESGRFFPLETAADERLLTERANNSKERVDSCVAFVEKERVGWEFYTKHWSVPVYTGCIDREFVNAQKDKK